MKEFIDVEKILRFEITDKCNLKCDICWSTEWTHRDLPTEDIVDLIECFAKVGGKIVVFTSREPLMSKSIYEALNMCKKHDLKIVLLTNGVLIREGMASNLLEQYDIQLISLSIHGDECEHDKLVKVRGAYRRTLEGIAILNKVKMKNNLNNIEIRLTAPLSLSVCNNIEHIIDVCVKNNVTLRLQHLMWHPRIVKDLHKSVLKNKYDVYEDTIEGFNESCEVSSNKIIELIKIAEKTCKERGVELQIYPKLSTEEIRRWYSDSLYVIEKPFCSHAQDSLRVRADGSVSLCQYIDLVDLNIKEFDFENMFSDSILLENEKKLLEGDIYPLCHRCCHIESRNNYKENAYDNGKI